MHATPSDPNWNPDADLNKDLIVNNLDLLICAVNYGLDIWTHFELGPPPIGTQRVVKPYPGNRIPLPFTWNTTGVAKGNYTIKAEATPVPYEIDLDDNSYTDGTVRVNMVGDLNGDGKVSITDIVIIALRFGWEEDC